MEIKLELKNSGAPRV